MRQRCFAAGETIYREGDPGDAVYFIESGEVEVLRKPNNYDVILGVLHKGGIFGEIGVVQQQPHSTTVRALTELSLLEVKASEFLQAFSDGNSIALPLIRLLCARLAEADQRIVERTSVFDGAVAAHVRQLLIKAGTEVVEAQIGSKGFEISQLPFKVGRWALPSQPARITETQLSLTVDDFSNMEIDQFAIEELDKRLIIRDLDTEIGTTVNGVRISKFESTTMAPLMHGENLIISGNLESPFSFRIIVRTRKQ